MKASPLAWGGVEADGTIEGRLRPGKVLILDLPYGIHHFESYLHTFGGNWKRHGVDVDVEPDDPVYLKLNYHTGLDANDVAMAVLTISPIRGMKAGAIRGAAAGASASALGDTSPAIHEQGEYLEPSETGPDDVARLKVVSPKSRQ